MVSSNGKRKLNLKLLGHDEVRSENFESEDELAAESKGAVNELLAAADSLTGSNSYRGDSDTAVDSDDVDSTEEFLAAGNEGQSNAPNPGGSLLDQLGMQESDEDEDAIWVKELLSSKNLLIKTDLSDRAIPVVSMALTKAVKYRSKTLWTYLINYLKLRISLNRQGRSELVSMALRRSGREDADWDNL